MKKQNEIQDKILLRISDRTRTAIKSDGTRIPVVDSRYTMLIVPDPEDIKNGIKGDPANCMYCLACRRQFHSELAWVARGVAYIELPAQGGKTRLERFILTDPAKLNVKNFDEGEDIPHHAVIFAAPSKNLTLAAITAAWKKHQKRKAEGKVIPRKALVKGEIKEKKRHKHELASLTIRDPQTGRFHFKQRTS